MKIKRSKRERPGEGGMDGRRKEGRRGRDGREVKGMEGGRE